VSVGERKITLEAEDTKNAEPRIIPMIDGLPELFEGLRRENPDAEYVFLRKGERIKTIIKAWRNACVRAGIRVKINGVEVVSHFEKDGTYRGFLFHDLRRSAV
jgi:integrase